MRMVLFPRPAGAAGTPLPDRPAVRPDLRWLRSPDGAFLVKDGRTGMRLRMGSAERTLCGLLDGTRSAGEVAEEAAAALQRPVHAGAVERFAQTLAHAGALAGVAEPRRHRPAALALLQLDPFFERWAARLRWWFTPAAQGTVLLLAAWAAAVATWVLGKDTWRRAWGLSTAEWLAVMAVDALGLVLHEAAHGLVSRHFGARVGAVMLLTFKPFAVATVDVSEARHAGRWRTALVLLAGPQAHLVLASIAVAGAALAPSSSWSGVAQVCAALQYAHCAFALVPFRESDGYYLLSALAGIPNLSKVSRQTLATFTRGPAWERHAEWTSTARSRVMFCLAFGTATMLWRAVAAAAVAAAIWLAAHGSAGAALGGS